VSARFQVAKRVERCLFGDGFLTPGLAITT
jgi:hypothetical protein